MPDGAGLSSLDCLRWTLHLIAGSTEVRSHDSQKTQAAYPEVQGPYSEDTSTPEGQTQNEVVPWRQG